MPPRVARLLNDAKRRFDQLEEESRVAIPAFVPSDFPLVYRALAEIKSANLATGRRFLEWGSGIGVIACLAEELGFEAAGRLSRREKHPWVLKPPALRSNRRSSALPNNSQRNMASPRNSFAAVLSPVLW